MISIDQNCHPLWDVVPKLQALARRGPAVTHYVEDVDAAFTSMGAEVGGIDLRLARERFHRSGGADWGAALFYTEFLGRVPVELRDWEPLTGRKTNVLARQLGRSVDELYDEFSPSDNWQLIGSSFVGDRSHHRVLRDLTVAEAGPFVRELLDKARTDVLRAFPAPASQQRVNEWFQRENARLEALLDELAAGRLVELYERWMQPHLPNSVEVDTTSRLFSTQAEHLPGQELLEAFLADYDRAAGLYNEAVAESDSKLRPLRTKDGELPFFAALERSGHAVRTGVFLDAGRLRIGERHFAPAAAGRLPLADLAAAGVRTLAGKALVLVTQVRLGAAGRPLALPHRGSLYMPAAHLLARKLADGGLLRGELKPVVRIRFRLLDRLRSLEAVIRLPDHLAAEFGREEVPARELGENWQAIAAEAARRLEAFRDEAARRRWQQAHCADLLGRIDGLDRRRRDLARRDPKAPQLRAVWMEIRRLQADLLDRTVRRIDRDTQLAELDYYDSRGALLPWCIALGGEAFYNQVMDQAEMHPEDSLREPGRAPDG
jgi:hypothetical protein